MKLRVQYMAQLRVVVGLAEELVELSEENSLAELLKQLAFAHASAKAHLVTETGDARPSLLIVVNEAAVPTRKAAMTLLHSGDVVTLLPPIAGG